MYHSNEKYTDLHPKGDSHACLVATRKFRGKMKKTAVSLIKDYSDIYQFDRNTLWMVYTIGLSEEVRHAAQEAARELGFSKIHWIQANGVITTHGGPAAFGIAGFSR